MADWPVPEGWTELLDTCLREGPQTVIRDGRPTAILVALEDWERLQNAQKHAQKYEHSVLLAPEPKLDDFVIPRRGRLRRRPFDPTMLDD